MAKRNVAEFNNDQEAAPDINTLSSELPMEAVEKKEIKKEVSTDTLTAPVEKPEKTKVSVETTKDSVSFKNVKEPTSFISGNGLTSVR